MSTEDDLRHLGQAAAALAGMAAARAKQVAEQLLGPRPQPREDPKQRAGRFVEEGRHAAADVVSALRREASVILRDLEHLEQTLREGDGHGGASRPGDRTATVTPIERAPAKRSASRATGTAKTTAKATKTSATGKAAATKAAKKTAPQAKKATGSKAAGARKTTGGSGRSPSEGQG